MPEDNPTLRAILKQTKEVGLAMIIGNRCEAKLAQTMRLRGGSLADESHA